jgi:hypothetical protein
VQRRPCLLVWYSRVQYQFMSLPARLMLQLERFGEFWMIGEEDGSRIRGLTVFPARGRPSACFKCNEMRSSDGGDELVKMS